MTKKNLLIPVTVMTLTGALFLGFNGTVSAQTNDSSLLKQVANKLNLNQMDVQAVLDGIINTSDTDTNGKVEARLNDAVARGEISVAQKQSILQELDKLQAEKDAMDLQNMTPAQQREAVKKLTKELVDWAKANKIDLNLLVEVGLGIVDTNATVGLSLL